MRVRLLLFAAFRETIGATEKSMEIPEGATVEELFDTLRLNYPILDALRPYTTFAVNREIVPPAHALRADDEVAFLQPASGGFT